MIPKLRIRGLHQGKGKRRMKMLKMGCNIPRIRRLTIYYYLMVAVLVATIDPPQTIGLQVVAAFWIFVLGIGLNYVLNKFDFGY